MRLTIGLPFDPVHQSSHKSLHLIRFGGLTERVELTESVAQNLRVNPTMKRGERRLQTTPLNPELLLFALQLGGFAVEHRQERPGNFARYDAFKQTFNLGLVFF